MSKAHEEGCDLVSSERLASAFMSLGIAESTDEVEIEPTTYKAVLQSPQASEWKDAMHREWQASGKMQCIVSGKHWSRTTSLISFPREI